MKGGEGDKSQVVRHGTSTTLESNKSHPDKLSDGRLRGLQPVGAVTQSADHTATAWDK